MRKFRIAVAGIALGILVPIGLMAQKGIYPSETMSAIQIVVYNPDKLPVNKATVTFRGGGNTYTADTDTRGVADLLVAKGIKYAIDVEDSLAWDTLDVPNKPMQALRYRIYYWGILNGKMMPAYVNPQYEGSKQRAAAGMVNVKMTFYDLKEKALAGEHVLLFVSDTAKGYKAVTDAAGVARFTVPGGMKYTVRVKYCSKFDQIDLGNIYYGSANATLTYHYLGTAEIERRIAENKEKAEMRLKWATSSPYTPTSVSVSGAEGEAPEEIYVNQTAIETYTALASETGGEFYVTKHDKLLETIEKILKNKVPDFADVVFLIDNSGSMADNIDLLKENLIRLSATLMKTHGVRIGVATYSDKNCDGPTWFAMHDLSNDVTQVQNNLKKLTLLGGGDYPESVYDGLANTIDRFTWKAAKNRIVLVFGDAPPLDGAGTTNTKSTVVAKCKSSGVKTNLYPVLIGY